MRELTIAAALETTEEGTPAKVGGGAHEVEADLHGGGRVHAEAQSWRRHRVGCLRPEVEVAGERGSASANHVGKMMSWDGKRGWVGKNVGVVKCWSGVMERRATGASHGRLVGYGRDRDGKRVFLKSLSEENRWTLRALPERSMSLRSA